MQGPRNRRFSDPPASARLPAKETGVAASTTTRASCLLLLVASSLVLYGCFICGEGELRIVSGSFPLCPGESIQFEFLWDGDILSSPEHCSGFWTVGETLGGDEVLGTVTGCGLYTAPQTLPATRAPVVCANRYEPGTCADCCPYACRTIELDFSQQPGGHE